MLMAAERELVAEYGRKLSAAGLCPGTGISTERTTAVPHMPGAISEYGPRAVIKHMPIKEYYDGSEQAIEAP